MQKHYYYQTCRVDCTILGRGLRSVIASSIYQSERSQNRKSFDAGETELDKTEHDDHDVETVPPVLQVTTYSNSAWPSLRGEDEVQVHKYQ